jgi:hypothetical protein
MNRPDLFVYLGLAAAWVFIAAWTYRISKKVDRLKATVDAETPRVPAGRL